MTIDETPMDDVQPGDDCEYPGCDDEVHNFPERFPVVTEDDDPTGGRLAMCDEHHVAARILAHTRRDAPYVDVGLYSEVTFYARQLAAGVLGFDDASDVVELPDGS